MAERIEQNDDLLVGSFCDLCGHRAFVLVRKAALELTFCAHHYTAFEWTLLMSGFAVSLDERERLTAR